MHLKLQATTELKDLKVTHEVTVAQLNDTAKELHKMQVTMELERRVREGQTRELKEKQEKWEEECKAKYDRTLVELQAEFDDKVGVVQEQLSECTHVKQYAIKALEKHTQKYGAMGSHVRSAFGVLKHDFGWMKDMVQKCNAASRMQLHTYDVQMGNMLARINTHNENGRVEFERMQKELKRTKLEKEQSSKLATDYDNLKAEHERVKQNIRNLVK